MTTRIFQGFLIPLLIAAVTQGAVYTRWGKPSCSDRSSLVYKGFAASAQYQTKGGASSYLCLTRRPTFLPFQRGVQEHARIAPVEFQSTAPMGDIFDHNSQCAVCQTSRRDVLMIPGTYSCPPLWNTEYYGYLMTSRDNYARSEVICVDRYPQPIRGSQDHTQQAADIFNIETHCDGNILCPPYKSNKELTCVVCTR
jgi:hypothetical protein